VQLVDIDPPAPIIHHLSQALVVFLGLSPCVKMASERSHVTGTPGISFQWKWGAAVYALFSTNYNSLDVKPTHQNACSYNNGDHAGTPENAAFQSTVVGGGTGGVGSNFTGSWSGTVSVTPVCSQ
jgi:hypothetical protein